MILKQYTSIAITRVDITMLQIDETTISSYDPVSTKWEEYLRGNTFNIGG